jgi:hypothetical protein
MASRRFLDPVVAQHHAQGQTFGVSATTVGTAEYAFRPCPVAHRVLAWQFTEQTFLLRPRILLVTSSDKGLCRPHLKHDIVGELLPSTGIPKADPAFLAV